MLLVSEKFKDVIFITVILIIISFQVPFLINGKAITGKAETDKYYDRIIEFSNDQKDLISFINSRQDKFGYILPIPHVEYGRYIFDKDDLFIRQDIVAKYINKPFIYPSSWGGINTNTYTSLINTLKEKDYRRLRGFPIQYVLYRRDVVCDDCLYFSEEELNDNFTKTYENGTYALFFVKDSTSIIKSKNIIYKIINPTKYHTRFDNISKPIELDFLLSYNKNWTLYLSPTKNSFKCEKEYLDNFYQIKECVDKLNYIEGDEFTYFLKSRAFEKTHADKLLHSNSWKIDPKLIVEGYNRNYYVENASGTISFEMILYYLPQNGLYVSLIISSIVFFVLKLFIKVDISKFRLFNQNFKEYAR